MSSVALIGANGQLGTDLIEQSGSSHEVIGVTRREVDIRDHARVAQFLGEARPEVIINTAAFVNVEQCEIAPEEAFAVNARAARNLALEAERIGAHLVHISTDYVFDGSSRIPYPESAATAPLNVYGRSKLEGEHHVRTLCRRHLVVRSSGLYGVAGSSGKGGNFVTAMLRIGREKGEVTVVDDQVLTPTNTRDLAQMIWRMVDGGAQGLFHATNSGSCSWYEFAGAIFELQGLNVAVHATSSASLGYKAARPAYSVLDNAKLEEAGFGHMRLWREALANHLEVMAPLT